MSREKKFRILIGNIWFYWGFVKRGEHLVFAGLPSTNIENLTMEELMERSEQFTGLLDRNGKEIYEGDIVLFDDDRHNYIVVWEICCWYLKDNDGMPELDWNPFSFSGGLEVIGNVHEHKELLESE